MIWLDDRRGDRIFTAYSLKGLDTFDGVCLSIWIISFFGLLESTLETTLISHCSGSCHCLANTLTLPEGFYMAGGAYCSHIGKTKIVEFDAWKHHLKTVESVDTYPSSSSGVILRQVSHTVSQNCPVAMCLRIHPVLATFLSRLLTFLLCCRCFLGSCSK